MLWRRLILALSAVIVLAACGVAARFYAVDGGGEYSGVFGIFILAAAGLTIGAVMLIVRAWRVRGSMPFYAALVSGLAALSILSLAAAINLRG